MTGTTRAPATRTSPRAGARCAPATATVRPRVHWRPERAGTCPSPSPPSPPPSRPPPGGGGAGRPRYRDGAPARALASGEVVHLSIPFTAIAHDFHAGSRVL